jgi:hypothetical protein
MYNQLANGKPLTLLSDNRANNDICYYIDNIALRAIKQTTASPASLELKTKLLRQLKSLRAIVEKA